MLESRDEQAPLSVHYAPEATYPADICVLRYALERNARSRPDDIFAAFEGGERWTFAQTLEQVAALAGNLHALGVRQDAHDQYIKNVDAEHEQLIWTHPGMTTYYRNRRGRVFSAMPWRFVDYWAMTHDPDFSQYRQTAG